MYSLRQSVRFWGAWLQVGAMLPFFVDFMSLIGAIGFTPMDFVLPQFLWIKAYKPKGFS